MHFFKKIALLTILVLNITTIYADNDEFRTLTPDIGAVSGLTCEEVNSFNKNLNRLNHATAIMLLRLSYIDVSPKQRQIILIEFVYAIPVKIRIILRKLGYFELEIFEDHKELQVKVEEEEEEEEETIENKEETHCSSQVDTSEPKDLVIKEETP